MMDLSCGDPEWLSPLLVVIDAHSKWIEVYPVRAATSNATIQQLRITFAQFGIPEAVVSDNGQCFVSAEFEEFLSHNGIKHLKSAPYHPASNGLAERAVQIFKRGMKKMKAGSLTDRIARVLFLQGNTGSFPKFLQQGGSILNCTPT